MVVCTTNHISVQPPPPPPPAPHCRQVSHESITLLLPMNLSPPLHPPPTSSESSSVLLSQQNQCPSPPQPTFRYHWEWVPFVFKHPMTPWITVEKAKSVSSTITPTTTTTTTTTTTPTPYTLTTEIAESYNSWTLQYLTIHEHFSK